MVKDYTLLIPIINEENTWKMEDDKVIITKEKNKIFKKIFSNKKCKEKSEIELGGYGSFVWKKIDGEKNISEIVDEIVREMGEEKETACKRAAIFFEMLRVHRLISFKRD
jgi:hypothetical protein